MFNNFSLMSIVSKMLRCAVCYCWMAHLALIVVYIQFAWNYIRFNSNDYYLMRFTHLQKSPNYANKSLNYFAVSDSWIPVWSIGWYCGAGVFRLVGCTSLSLSLALSTFFNNNNNNNNNNEAPFFYSVLFYIILDALLFLDF